MSEHHHLETDPRFPSGRWVGFWIQKELPPGKFQTELLLTFSDGVLRGEGRDRVGLYDVHGRYDLSTGRCHWIKTYRGRHDVHYDGYNEGQGIWGTWTIRIAELNFTARGGFHIWPEEMTDPSQRVLVEEADLPAELVGT